MGDIASVLQVLPWAIPVLAAFGIMALLGARSLARLLGSPRWVAVLLVMSVGLVVAITLTRQDVEPALRLQAINPSPSPVVTPLLRPPWQWWAPSDRLLNIAIFLPLGLAVMLVGRRGLRRCLVVAALALPLMVEGTQWAVTWLQRDPQWQDVLDNTIGVLLGMALGLALRAWLARGSSDRAG